jgi:hydrogenase/urease accessory protein HupE
MRLILICCMALIGAIVSPALAHTDVGQTDSFACGIAHPLNGTDHILAMVTVGLWSVVAGGRAMLIWPMTFVSTMLVGFAAATLGLEVPFVEPAIWSSVIILGVFVALLVKAPVWAGAVIAGFSHSFMATPMAQRSQPLVSFLMRQALLSPPLCFMQPALGLGFSPKTRSARPYCAAWSDFGVGQSSCDGGLP